MRTIGDFHHRIAILVREPTIIDGRSSEAWHLLGVYAAEVMHSSARDYAKAAAEWTESVIIVHMRTLRTRVLDSSCRLQCLGVTYSVEEVVPDKPKAGFVELRARAVEMEGLTHDSTVVAGSEAGGDAP